MILQVGNPWPIWVPGPRPPNMPGWIVANSDLRISIGFLFGPSKNSLTLWIPATQMSLGNLLQILNLNSKSMAILGRVPLLFTSFWGFILDEVANLECMICLPFLLESFRAKCKLNIPYIECLELFLSSKSKAMGRPECPLHQEIRTS